MPLYQQINLYGVNKRLVWKSRRDEVVKAWEIGLKDAQTRRTARDEPAARGPAILDTSAQGTISMRLRGPETPRSAEEVATERLPH